MRNYKAFSLVEVLIAMAVMSILALTFTKISLTMSKQNARQNHLNDLQTLVSSVYGVLSHQTSCTAAFTGQTYNPNGLPMALSGPLKIGGTTLSPGSTFAHLKVNSLQWTAPDSILGTSSELVAGIPTNLTSHLTNLSITVSPKTTSLSTVPITRKLSFILSVDAGNAIRSCYSTIDSTAVCSQLGGIMTGGRCNILEQINDSLQSNNVGGFCSPVGTTNYSSYIGRFVCNSKNKWDLLQATTKCQMLGGVVLRVFLGFSMGNICRFPGNVCLGGSSFAGYSTTIPNTCNGGSTSGCNSGFSCTTGSHGAFSATSIETCWASQVVACGPATSGGVLCNATITNIGCTMP